MTQILRRCTDRQLKDMQSCLRKITAGGAFHVQPSTSVHETEVFFHDSSMHHFEIMSFKPYCITQLAAAV